MSRSKNSNDIVTQRKKVRVGKRVIEDGEPKALVGPESNRDTFSLQDMAVALYGPGTKCIIEQQQTDMAANY